MKTAIIHDWLTGMRGGEKILEKICRIFPAADIYTIVWNKGRLSSEIESHRIITSFVQKLPSGTSKYRYYLPLMPAAIEAFDLRGYELIFSISHCVAKGIEKKPGQTHICYCNTPMRYVWDFFGDYFSPRKNFFTWAAMSFFRPYLKWWDKSTARGVDYFIANSENVAERVKRHWGRDSAVIYPPVDTEFYTPSPDGAAEEDFYLAVSALVPYKKIDLAVKAFNMLGKKLKIIGTGPEADYLQKIAGPTIEFLGWRDAEAIRDHYRKCRALIFPGEEDFGIVPLEAQSCGRPVIAYGKGGALETVIDGETGVFFCEQTENALRGAVERLEQIKFDAGRVSAHASKFSDENFNIAIKKFLTNHVPGFYE